MLLPSFDYVCVVNILTECLEEIEDEHIKRIRSLSWRQTAVARSSIGYSKPIQTLPSYQKKKKGTTRIFAFTLLVLLVFRDNIQGLHVGCLD